VIERILPDVVVAVDTRDDMPDRGLFPAEEAVVRNAVTVRRREFVTGRECARQALKRLGCPRLAIPSGEHGEPVWPEGVVGSITHCLGYRACAVARSTEVTVVGIDAEPNVNLPRGLLERIVTPEERLNLRRVAECCPMVCWETLVFSAKEAVYKTVFTLTKERLDFDDAVITVADGTFCARLLARAPSTRGRCLEALHGRWLVCDGLVLTAIALRTGGLRAMSGDRASPAVSRGNARPHQSARANRAGDMRRAPPAA
jgi:4'-phosphopantetheinyl transferase EntD